MKLRGLHRDVSNAPGDWVLVAYDPNCLRCWLENLGRYGVQDMGTITSLRIVRCCVCQREQSGQCDGEREPHSGRLQGSGQQWRRLCAIAGRAKNQATVHVELEASFCSRRAVEKEKLLTATFDRVDVSASACFSSETSDDAGAEDVLSTVGTLAVR